MNLLAAKARRGISFVLMLQAKTNAFTELVRAVANIEMRLHVFEIAILSDSGRYQEGAASKDFVDFRDS
jgi:hypothetical protein